MEDTKSDRSELIRRLVKLIAPSLGWGSIRILIKRGEPVSIDVQQTTHLNDDISLLDKPE